MSSYFVSWDLKDNYKTALSEAQKDSIFELSKYCGDRQYPLNVITYTFVYFCSFSNWHFCWYSWHLKSVKSFRYKNSK